MLHLATPLPTDTKCLLQIVRSEHVTSSTKTRMSAASQLAASPTPIRNKDPRNRCNLRTMRRPPRPLLSTNRPRVCEVERAIPIALHQVIKLKHVHRLSST